MKNTVAIKEIELEIIPIVRDFIQPLSPNVTRKNKKLEINMNDKVL
jgi:hypothetical protein